MILQKFIAQSGYCSRRQAEEYIRAGRVFVNEKKAELGQVYQIGDVVRVDKQLIEEQKNKIYLAVNKPVGYVCTNAMFKDEKSVFELLSKEYHGRGLFAVGRLDKNSRGLVVLTNDGDWANLMTHPRYEHEKEYVVTINNSQLTINQSKEIIAYFGNGIDIGEGDGVVRVKDVEYLGEGRFRIILTEGKKRQIRRMFKVVGLEVEDLCRVRIGDVQLSGIKESEYKIIKINKS